MRQKAIAMKLLTLTLLASLTNTTIKDNIGSSENPHNLSKSTVEILNTVKETNNTIIDTLEQKTHEEDGTHKSESLNTEEEGNHDEREQDPGVDSIQAVNTEFDVKEEENEESYFKIWLIKNQKKIVNVLLMIVGIALLVLICYKYYSINLAIKVKHAEIQNYANQLENIMDGADKLVFITWKDQKEGIQFVDNPAHKKKINTDLTKTEQIQAEIAKVEEDIKKKAKEIDSLKEKESYYTGEIAKLETELEEAKTLVLDEGAALGFAESVLKEFK